MTGDTEDEVIEILSRAKGLAQRYRELTGKPLGITGEVAEFEAARLLGLELVKARQAGFDAGQRKRGKTRRLQIKGRCVLPGSNPGQRLGTIDIRKEFDAVLLVLMDGSFNATAIYEAERDAVVAALTAPGSIARNRRGALGVAAAPGRQDRRDGREPGQRMARPADEEILDTPALQSADEIADLPRAAVEVPAGFDVQHLQDGIT